MAFGRPRQEDLVEFLPQVASGDQYREEMTISLEPPGAREEG
jgi:hypothetical protein